MGPRLTCLPPRVLLSSFVVVAVVGRPLAPGVLK
jgi:hypothetical protein